MYKPAKHYAEKPSHETIFTALFAVSTAVPETATVPPTSCYRKAAGGESCDGKEWGPAPPHAMRVERA